MENGQSIGALFIKDSVETFKSYKQLADRAIAQLEDESSLHWSPHPDVNSIAIIVKHLSGNMQSRWTDFLTTDGEKPDRDRDWEFVDGEMSWIELFNVWERGWNALFDALAGLREEHLQQIVYIRQEPLTVVKAIVRQISHYAYHVGQIVHIAKEIKGEQFVSLSIPKKK
jgi:hypothetical protein